MDVRAYSLSDRDACMAVFDSNVPAWFLPEDRGDFEKFLHQPPGPYFVMEHESALLACGGYYVADGAARLAWGMVHGDWQRRGLGRLLLLYRLRDISKTAGAPLVQLSTSSLTAPFFGRQGFKRASIIRDGYAPGLDRVEMAMRLTVCP